MPGADFSPPRWAQNPWVQTVGALCWPSQAPHNPNFRSSLHTMPLEDGDALALTLYDRQQGASARRAVLVHGLCGDQESNYMRRSAQRLMEAGYELCMVNLRGAGPGYALASLPYHAGRSEDVAAVVAWLKTRNPAQPLDLLGFSLGGNIVLNYLARAGARGETTVDRALTISAPIDLERSCQRLIDSPLGLADRFFSRLLSEHVKRVHDARDDLGPPPKWPSGFNVRDFDELYTAPRGGFRDAADYYAKASARTRLTQIQIPTTMIWAKDDPLIDQDSLKRAQVSDAVTLAPTARGGHIGYLDPRSRGLSRFWLLDQLPDYLEALA